MTFAAVESSSSPVAAAVPCLHCEYDLRGLPRDGRCPECGALVEPSLRRQEQMAARGDAPLSLSSPRWLRRLAAACVLAALAGAAAGVEAVFIVTRGWFTWLMVLSLLNLGLLTAALWWFGTPEPVAAHRRRQRVVSIVARAAAAFQLGVPVISIFAIEFATNLSNFFRGVSVAQAIVAAGVTWVLLRHVARLLVRGGRRRLAAVATTLAWIAPLAWLLQSWFDPSFILLGWARGEWMLTLSPLVGFPQALTVVPYTLIVWQRFDARFIAWMIEAALSLLLMLLMLQTARVLHAAAKEAAAHDAEHEAAG